MINRTASLIGIAALFLATGTAHASEYYLAQCGSKLVYVLGHHGYTFSQIDVDGNLMRELPIRLFRFTGIALYFRGHKCQLESLASPWPVDTAEAKRLMTLKGRKR
jgi:hypothetical protein